MNAKRAYAWRISKACRSRFDSFNTVAANDRQQGLVGIGWHRQERGLNKPKEKIIRVDDPRLEELEMELKKHNDVLAEIEKLLDGNLANVDPAKHAELTAERDRLLEERDELASGHL